MWRAASGRGEVGTPGTGPRRSCYSDTGMLAMPLSKVITKSRDYSRLFKKFICYVFSCKKRINEYEIIEKNK